MSEYQYEDIGTAGSYMKWENVGDVVEGIIVTSSPDQGTDFDGNPVPQVVVRTDDGDTIVINGSQAALKRAFVQGADRLRPGHRCRIEYTGTYETDRGTPGKSFRVQATPQPVMDDVTDVAANDPTTEPF
jgi:hypothetical protein